MNIKSGPLSLSGSAVCVLLSLLLLPALPAGAFEDDFAFAETLVEAKHFDLARTVYDDILADEARSPADRDRVTYERARVEVAEADASALPDAGFTTVRGRFDEAVETLRSFVRRHPESAHTVAARIEIGAARVRFAEWAPARGEHLDQIRSALDEAIAELEELDFDPRAVDTALTARYLRALTYTACSDRQVAALHAASVTGADALLEREEPVSKLVPRDLLGRIWHRMALCETEPARRRRAFDTAFQWFATCLDALAADRAGWRRAGAIHLHIAQAGLDAGRRRDLAERAVEVLEAALAGSEEDR